MARKSLALVIGYHLTLLFYSIICATALVKSATLISSDKQLSKIVDLNVLSLKRFCE